MAVDLVTTTPGVVGLGSTAATLNSDYADPSNTTTQNVTNVTCNNDYCVSDEEYIDMIQKYIFPTVFEWIVISVYIVVFVVGLVGNFLVCFAVWRNHHMRTVTNFFIVNLAMADFLVILVCLPPTVLDDVTETWYMGRIMCKIVKYLQNVSVSVSVLTLSSISVERYYAICHPLKFKSTVVRARVIIFGTWLVALSISVPELVVMDAEPYGNINPELSILLTRCRPFWEDVSSQAALQLFFIAALYVTPFCLMVYTYARIITSLWHHSVPMEQVTTTRHPQDSTNCMSVGETQLQARRRAAKMLIAVVVMFGICYLPVHLLNIIRYAVGFTSIPRLSVKFALISHWLCYFNSAVNPVIYNFMSAKFRSEFRNACSCCFTICCSEPTNYRRYNGSTYTYKYTNTLSHTEQVSMSTLRSHNMSTVSRNRP